MTKPKKQTFDVYVRRNHFFTATIEAATLDQALEIANNMTEDDLLDAPGDTLESVFDIEGALKNSD